MAEASFAIYVPSINEYVRSLNVAYNVLKCEYYQFWKYHKNFDEDIMKFLTEYEAREFLASGPDLPGAMIVSVLVE